MSSNKPEIRKSKSGAMLVRSRSISNLQALLAPPPEPEHVVSKLVLQHSFLIQLSRKDAVDELFDHASKINTSLMRDRGSENIKRNLNRIDILLEKMHQLKYTGAVKELIANTLYLKACSLLQLEVCKDGLAKLEPRKLIHKTMLEALEAGFIDTKNAEQTMYNYYIQLQELYAASTIMDKEDDFVWDDENLRKSICELNFLCSFDDIRENALKFMDVTMPKLAKELLDHALHLDSKFNHTRLLTYR